MLCKLDLYFVYVHKMKCLTHSIVGLVVYYIPTFCAVVFVLHVTCAEHLSSEALVLFEIILDFYYLYFIVPCLVLAAQEWPGLSLKL